MFAPLRTDFYQLAMAIAYLYANKQNDLTGFEAFVRTVRHDINPEKSFYIFKGEDDVHRYMKRVRTDINNPLFFETMWNIVKKNVTHNQEEIKALCQERFNSMVKDFYYTVLPDGTILKPLIPAFQFFGSPIIGQLIESHILNIINGQTGLETYAALAEDQSIVRDLVEMVYPESIGGVALYIEDVKAKAIELRSKTTKPIFEAGFRRAPSYLFSIAAVKACMEAGFNGTSHLGALEDEIVSIDHVGGTMGHAFVMSFKTELEAFQLWNELYPNSTILLDTYDTINAVNMLIENNIKPSTVRIDSEPLDVLSFKVREILDNAGWNDVKIYISGDITPEIIEDFENRNVPYDLFMVGTKVVNVNLGRFLNAGFVYKVVEVRIKDEILYPEKKAFGKGNYPGLKSVRVENNEVKMTLTDSFGFYNVQDITPSSTVFFEKTMKRI